MAGTGSPLDDRWRKLTPKTQPTASGADQSTRKRSLGITELMTIVDETHSPSGGHRTPEVRQARGRPRRFVKLDQAALEDVAAAHDLTRGPTALLGTLIKALAYEWRYEPRILQARSRRELWQLLEHCASRSLPALLAADLVAEHPGTGFEVLCWDQVVADTARDYDRRRARAVKDLAAEDRRAATVETLYAASLTYELPATTAHNVHTTAHNVHTSENNVRGRPAVSRALEPLELLEPPLPPIDSQQRPSEAVGVGMESVPDKPAEVLDLDDKRAARYRAEVLDALADLEATAAEAAGTTIINRDAYRAPIKRRNAANEALAAEIDAYQEQYPDLEAAELAERIWADRSPGAQPVHRPTVEDQSAEGWKARAARGIYADELAEVARLEAARAEGG